MGTKAVRKRFCLAVKLYVTVTMADQQIHDPHIPSFSLSLRPVLL